MIFADTSALFLIFAERKQRNTTRATAWFGSNRRRLVTTDYVVDELLTLLRSRREYRRAIIAGRELWSENFARIEYLTQADIAAAWEVFQRYDDKQWSFTDCTSMVVMRRLGVDTAFAFDEHFRQFQTVNVVP